MDIKLYYFDFPFWRAEASRMALHIGGVAFEDVRLDGATFRKMKASGELPYGQLPVMDVDGVRVGQSVAIARFCGRVSGLYPSDILEAFRVDELLDTANQITAELTPSMRERDPAAKLALRQALATGTLPMWLERLELRLERNSAVSGFFVGAEPTVADLVMWCLTSWLSGGILDGIPTTLLDPYVRLVAHRELVAEHPGVCSWREAGG